MPGSTSFGVTMPGSSFSLGATWWGAQAESNGNDEFSSWFSDDVDDEGNTSRPHITDPKQITARNVEVTGVTFIPDKSFIDDLKEGTTTINVNGSGVVATPKQHDRQEVINALNKYLAEHGSITRRGFAMLLKVSDYEARKWLKQLTTEPYPKYVARKQGNTIVYRRYGSL